MNGHSQRIQCACWSWTSSRCRRSDSTSDAVILAAEHYSEWLAEGTPVNRLREMLVPYPAGEMEPYRVSFYHSKATNEGPECIAPIEADSLSTPTSAPWPSPSAPYEAISIVAAAADGPRRLFRARWGLLPHWADHRDERPAPYNARAD